MHLIWRPQPKILPLALPEPSVPMPCWKKLDAVITKPLEALLVGSTELELPALKLWLELADGAIGSAECMLL